MFSSHTPNGHELIDVHRDNNYKQCRYSMCYPVLLVRRFLFFKLDYWIICPLLHL